MDDCYLGLFKNIGVTSMIMITIRGEKIRYLGSRARILVCFYLPAHRFFNAVRISTSSGELAVSHAVSTSKHGATALPAGRLEEFFLAKL